MVCSFNRKWKKNNLNTIHTSNRFMCFYNQIWIVFILLFFLFLLKLPMIDIALLPYKQLICHMHCQKIWYLDIQHDLSETSMIWICHRHCHKIGKLESTGSYPSNQIYSQLCKSRKRKMMCSFNRKYKKMIWTQSTLPVGLYVFRIKFGLCSYYFFFVSIETTNDWYRIARFCIENRKNDILLQ